MKFDIQILETLFDVVSKFHVLTPSVEEVITILYMISKQHAACLFIGLSNNMVYGEKIMVTHPNGWTYIVEIAKSDRCQN